MDLCPPFDGWTLDLEGVIHTPSGYRCTPAQIEAALWLFGMLRFDQAKRPIYADSIVKAVRPLYETSDLIGEDLNRLQIIAQRRSNCCPQCGAGPVDRLPGETYPLRKGE